MTDMSMEEVQALTDFSFSSEFIHGVVLTERGLTIPDGIDYNQYVDVGMFLAHVDHGLTKGRSVLSWAIGSWLAWGEEHFPDDRYLQAAAETGLSDQRLKNIAYVFGRFPDGPLFDLPFETHAAVAGLPDGEREAKLKEAAEQNLSSNDVKKAVQDYRAEEAGLDPANMRASKAIARAADLLARCDPVVWASLLFAGLSSIMPVVQDELIALIVQAQEIKIANVEVEYART